MVINKEKPNILCFDTSESASGVAIIKDGILAAEHCIWIRNMHDRLLAKHTENILADCEVELRQLDAIALSIGPGSFTGLRIGVAFVKGLSFQSTIPCIEVPTLQSFARAADEFARQMNATDICVVSSVQRDRYFYQHFTTNGLPKSTLNNGSIHDVRDSIKSGSILCGTAASEIDNSDIHVYRLSGLERSTPRFVARLALDLYNDKSFCSSQNLSPKYHQDFVVQSK